MRSALSAAALLLLLAIPPASGQSPADSGTASPLSTLFGTVDQSRDYVQNMAMGAMFQVETSKVALVRGGDERVKAFAQSVLDDNGWLSAQLAQIVEESRMGVALPVKLDRPHKKLLAELNATRRPDFDRLYVRMQVKAHEQALALHTTYGVKGDRKELHSLAETARPVIQARLKALRALTPGE